MTKDSFDPAEFAELLEQHGKNPSGGTVPLTWSEESCRNNPACGDLVTFYFENQEVIGYTAKGCVLSRASASLLFSFKTVYPGTDIIALSRSVARIQFGALDSLTALLMDYPPELQGDVSALLHYINSYPLRWECALLPFKAIASLPQ